MHGTSNCPHPPRRTHALPLVPPLLIIWTGWKNTKQRPERSWVWPTGSSTVKKSKATPCFPTKCEIKFKEVSLWREMMRVGTVPSNASTALKLLHPSPGVLRNKPTIIIATESSIINSHCCKKKEDEVSRCSPQKSTPSCTQVSNNWTITLTVGIWWLILFGRSKQK